MSDNPFAALQASLNSGAHHGNGAHHGKPEGSDVPQQTFGRLKPNSAPRPPILVPQSPPRASTSTSKSSAAVAPGQAFMSHHARTGTALIQKQAAEAYRPPEPKRTESYLKNLEDLHEKEKQAVKLYRNANSKNLPRDERLRLMEELNLKPGPWDFGPTDEKHPHFEPYSGHRLRVRSLPFADFQEIMTGRYFLSPSLLYSIKDSAPPGKGTDGDFNLPVDGDWVLIATITGFKRSWSCKEKQVGDSTSEDENDPFGGGDGKKRKKKSRDVGPRQRLADGSIQIEEEDRYRTLAAASGRYYDMADMSERDDGSGIKGHNQLSLSLVSSHWDEEGKRWVGGSRGAYEKLSKHAYSGVVLAFVNPRIVIPKRKEKEKFGRTRLQVNPRSAESVHIIGTCLDYALCEAIKKDGTKCGETVDRRNIRRGSAVCNYHLSRGVTKTQHGRQEFANGTTALGNARGGGYGSGSGSRWGSSGGGGGKSDSRGGDVDMPDDIWADNAKELQSHPGGRRQQKGQTIKRKWGALSFEGLQGPGKFFMTGANAKSQAELDAMARDPTDARFSVSERYGREKAEKEARRKKKHEEEEMLRRLETTRAGFDPDKVQSSQRARASKEEEAEDIAGLSLPSTSVGALAISDARRMLEARKEEAKAKERARTKRQKVQLAEANPGSNDRLLLFSSDSEASDDERERLKKMGRGGSAESNGTASNDQKWRHSAEAIKRMGFDPLSSARSRELRRSEQNSDDGARARSALLSRHTAAPSSLPKPSLKTSFKAAAPNVRDPAASRANAAAVAPAKALTFGKVPKPTPRGDGSGEGFAVVDSDSDLEIL